MWIKDLINKQRAEWVSCQADIFAEQVVSRAFKIEPHLWKRGTGFKILTSKTTQGGGGTYEATTEKGLHLHIECETGYESNLEARARWRYYNFIIDGQLVASWHWYEGGELGFSRLERKGYSLVENLFRYVEGVVAKREEPVREQAAKEDERQAKARQEAQRTAEKKNRSDILNKF